jgi:outer membrane protein
MLLKKILSCCVGFVFFCCQSNAQSVKELSLQDCIKTALQNATSVLKGNNSIAAAGLQVAATYAQFLPNAVAGGGYNFDRGNHFYSSTGPLLVNDNRSSLNYQLTSSLNIFTGYYNYTSWKASALNQKIASLTLERAKQQIKLDVTQAFLQVVLDKKIVLLDSANYDVSLKREAQLQMLTEVGRKARTELYQQQAQTSADKLKLINAKNKVQNDIVSLLQKLRIDKFDQYSLADVVIDEDANIAKYANEDALLNSALQDRVDFAAAKLATQAADLNISKLKSGYLPWVSLNAGLYNNAAYFHSLTVAQQNEQPSSQVSIPEQMYKYTFAMIGVNANWNIFDRYVTKTNVALTKIESENSRIDEQDIKLNIVASIKQAHNDYVNALQQIETATAGLTAAQKAFDAVNGRYTEGATDFITEQNAQQALLQAQQNRVLALVNMMLQKNVIDYLVGE